MGNLDFLEKKPNNVTVTVQIERDELGNLASDASNCLPALSIKTLYSKIGQTANSAADSSGANKDCAVRVSSNVDFTPTSNGKIYEYGDMSSPKTTDFNAIKFTNGVVYLYSTKNDMNIGSAGAPPPCIVVPKSFTDSDSSAVFEKGIYFGYGISSGKQGYYVKYEISYERVSINISGKGFTSPQKPYSYVSRSVKPDDDICVWINEARIPEVIDEEFVKGYNAFCNPGDFDSIAEIKLDENLANICKHAARQCLAIRTKSRGGTDYYYYYMEVGTSGDDNFIYYNVTYTKKGPDNNKVSGLYIEFSGSPAYFNPNVTSDEYTEWHDKYIAIEP